MKVKRSSIPAHMHLFARPSFWSGFARLADSHNKLNQYNISANGKEADWDALLSDWKAVGDDMWGALNDYKKKLKLNHGET